jgi:hypothetical protein
VDSLSPSRAARRRRIVSADICGYLRSQRICVYLRASICVHLRASICVHLRSKSICVHLRPKVSASICVHLRPKRICVHLRPENCIQGLS